MSNSAVKSVRGLTQQLPETGKCQSTVRFESHLQDNQEKKIRTLEKCYLNAQRQTTALQDCNDKLQTELLLHPKSKQQHLLDILRLLVM